MSDMQQQQPSFLSEPLQKFELALHRNLTYKQCLVETPLSDIINPDMDTESFMYAKECLCERSTMHLS